MYRAAYGRRTDKYPRRCVFFGTSNDSEFLKDATGNRRFWPVDVGVHPAKKSVWSQLPLETDQIWAEAYLYWTMGKPLLSSEGDRRTGKGSAGKTPGIIREGRHHPGLPGTEGTVKLGFTGPAEAEDVPEWEYELPDGTELILPRERVCAAEIWVECFRSELKYMKRSDSTEINNILLCLKGWERIKTPRRFGVYGQQRGFERVTT